MDAMFPSPFPRDQGRLGGVVRWGGRPVARGAMPHALDLAQAASTPIAVPGLDEVQSVAGDTVRFAGGLRDGAFAVLRERGGGWADLPLPPVMRDAPGERRIAVHARGEAVAVVWAGFDQARYASGLEWWNGRWWRSVPLEETGKGSGPKHVLVGDDQLLFGYSAGEWGGSVWRATPSGEVTEVVPDELPVQALVPLPGGDVLVGTGLAHLGSLNAHVGVLARDGSWSTLIRVDSYQRHAPVAWHGSPDSLEGLDVDALGRPCLLTGSRGVLRFERGRLVPVTPGWPPGEHLYGAGLLIEGEHAVIGTFDRGVLLWKLGTTEVRRVPIPR